ncbi:MAG: NYN domain-containing protein [Anaerolineales bacterium]|jgi:uncharacterized LabA/DUF88 family protein|nr:NYN domain-containing protein [Anaerolineales bacterium]
MNTYVYVDGFNLYYGAVKDTPYKWLDILKLCNYLLPKSNIVKIKYFTARISSRPDDPGKPTRQQIYLRALHTIPIVEIIFGSFLTKNVSLPLVTSKPGKMKFATVIRTEEKGSDVNLAAHMINDGYKGLYDSAVMVTNDSDLVEAIRIVKNELNKTVGILNPQKHPSSRLIKHATFLKQIRTGTLTASQFPATLTDSKGTFNKPKEW